MRIEIVLLTIMKRMEILHMLQGLLEVSGTFVYSERTMMCRSYSDEQGVWQKPDKTKNLRGQK